MVSNTTPIGTLAAKGACDPGTGIQRLVLGAGPGKVGIRTNNFPTMDIDVSGGVGNGNVYVAWNDQGLGDPDILVARSTNGGGAWNTPIRVNDDATGNGKDQFFPWLSVDPNGQVNMIWYDRRNDPNNLLIDVFHSESVNQGAVWDTNGKVTDVSFPPVVDVDPNIAGCYMGDYNGAASDANHIYAAWGDNRLGNPDVREAILHNTQQIKTGGNLSMTTCPASSASATLQVFNTGTLDLVVKTVSNVSGSPDITVDPNPATPVTVSPNAEVDFTVRCAPSTFGSKAATIEIKSNDTVNPVVDLPATCSVPAPVETTLIANSGSFGNVCLGAFADLPLTINNGGGCPLSVSSITSSSAEFVAAGVVSFPVLVGSGSSTAVPIRFKPTSVGASKSANITVASNDPVKPIVKVPVSGSTAPGQIKVSGSGAFGNVCAGSKAQQTITVANTGMCNLHVTGASINCPDFTIEGNPFPATLSPDSSLPLTIAFTPTSIGPKSCTLSITSDDPNNPTVSVPLTATTPGANIDVPSPEVFPPTVIQSVGACQSKVAFPVSNNGACPLQINSAVIGGANGSDYSLSGLPSLSTPLQPGHILGEGDLTTVFKPTLVTRNELGNVTVTYVTDPFMKTTATATSAMCGEGVRTGVRVLVTVGGVPAATVSRIHLDRLNSNRKSISVDNVLNAPLQTVTPNAPCVPFLFQREWGGVSNPIQLTTGDYQLTVVASVNGKKQSKTVTFSLSTCSFNQNIVVAF